MCGSDHRLVLTSVSIGVGGGVAPRDAVDFLNTTGASGAVKLPLVSPLKDRFHEVDMASGTLLVDVRLVV